MPQYTTTNAPLPWMEPYLQDYASRAQEYANQGYQQSPGSYVGPNNLLTSGWQATANRAIQGDPTVSAATTQLQNTINGGYLNGNPYLDQSIQDAQGDLTRSWNQVQKPAWDKAMQSSGSFGNTGVMESQGSATNDLQRNLGRISTDMRSNAYNTERGYQQQAIGMAPQFGQLAYQDANNLITAGQQQQTFQQGQQNQNQQWFQDAQNYPKDRLSFYGQALGQQPGGTSTTQQPDPSWMNQLFGGAIAGSQLFGLLGKP